GGRRCPEPLDEFRGAQAGFPVAANDHAGQLFGTEQVECSAAARRKFRVVADSAQVIREDGAGFRIVVDYQDAPERTGRSQLSRIGAHRRRTRRCGTTPVTTGMARAPPVKKAKARTTAQTTKQPTNRMAIGVS